MTAAPGAGIPVLPVYQEYQRQENTARNAYLQAVINAHAEYLAGPYPDRDAYNTVERSAWMTYYAQCRNLWRDYFTRCEQAASQLAYGHNRRIDDTLPPRPGGQQPSPRTGHPTNPYPEQDDTWLHL